MCGANGKFALKKRERQRAKKEIQGLMETLSTPTIEYTKKEYRDAARKATGRDKK